MTIIKSLLDNDLYKFTMQKAVLRKYPGTPVKYKFTNRNKTPYPQFAIERLRQEIKEMSTLKLTNDEFAFLKTACPFLDEGYLGYLNQYKYDPAEVSAKIVNDQLELEVVGTWDHAILWEVPLLAMVSECFYPMLTTEQSGTEPFHQKAKILQEDNCVWADFGTRRRRSYLTQYMCVGAMTHYKGFTGTSNVHLARQFQIKPIGTMAHEWIMGVSALESLRHANRYALRAWAEVFNGNLGIALPDTFGTQAFWEDFDPYLARLFDGVRHDSADPYVFGENLIKHYQGLRIDPMTKWAVFTDGLNPTEAVKIKRAFQNRIKVSFGIGTNFTNDFPPDKALNIVIKLVECGGLPVVKLSDVPTKATGDKDALRVAQWVFNRKPLD